MEYRLYEADVTAQLMNPKLAAEQRPVFMLGRETREPAASGASVLPKSQQVRVGIYWVAKSVLLPPAEFVEWAFVKTGDMVAIPLFPYLSPPGADISALMTHCFQAGAVALEGALLRFQKKPHVMHIVKAKRIYDMRTTPNQYRYALGVAISFPED